MVDRPLEHAPDQALVRICQNPEDDGFDLAFQVLYDRYKDRVYSIAYRMTGTATDALDVAQESFAVLFRKVGEFRFHAQFSTWLFRIVVNCSIDHLRRERSRSASSSSSLATLDDSAEPADPLASPDLDAEHVELGSHVHASLQRVSTKLRAVLVLRYLESLSYEEIADTLDVSLGTVKSRLARAHVAIERVLEGTLDNYGYPLPETGGAA